MLFTLALVTFAHAEEATFAGTAEVAEAPKSETRVTANIGGNVTAGNAEAYSLNGGFDVTHKWKRNQFGLVGGAALGYGAVDANADGFLSRTERCLGVSECAPSTERVTVDARYDRFFSKGASSLYVLVGAYHDKFAGFDYRAHGQLGYARHLVDTKRTHVKVELGADFATEDYVEGVLPNSTRLIAAQLGANIEHKFNENVGISDALIIYEPLLTQPDGSPFAPHFTDLRVTNTLALTAKMSDKFSISVSDTLAWRNEPVAAPEGIIDEGRSPVDNTLTIALVASIL